MTRPPPPKPSFPPGRVLPSEPRWRRPALIALGVWALVSCAVLFAQGVGALLETECWRQVERARELDEEQHRNAPRASDIETSGDVWAVDAGVEGRAAPLPMRGPKGSLLRVAP